MNVLKRLQERKWELALLFVIIAIGVFLRTYHFHDWLHFGSDQVRDLIMVEGVVEKGAPWPLLGADASNTHFKLGPLYHYFQIISLSVFRGSISAMAYPDLLFSLLAIVLFYVLFRRYFTQNLALALTGLYAVSFYAVEYSRFAWNPNPIPFFVMLYLYALLEFVHAREKVHLIWIVLLGIAIGVGVQLHTLLLLLLPILSLIVFLFLLKQNWRILGRIAMVLAVILLCNFGQIRSEMKTGGENTKRFLTAFTDRSDGGARSSLGNFKDDVLNHAQANAHILSSLGEKGHFTFSLILAYPEKAKDRTAYWFSLIGIAVSLVFSIFGYGLLMWRAWQEPDAKRKYFLIMMFLYIACSFIILFPIARGAPLRYFIHTIFVPFLFLGLFIEWLRAHFLQSYLVSSAILFLFLFGANAYTIGAEARELATGMRGDSGYVVLDEANTMVDSIIAKSLPTREANLIGRSQYMSTYYKSLAYLAEKKHFKLNRVSEAKSSPSDKPYFFISQSMRSVDSLGMSQYEFMGSENFGRVGLYQFKKR